MTQRIFNVITIAGSCMIIGFLSSTFYLGTFEGFQELRQSLFQSFINRFFVASLLGLPVLIVLVIGNMLFNSRAGSNRRIHIRMVFLPSLVATSTTAGLGTIFFFFR